MWPFCSSLRNQPSQYAVSKTGARAQAARRMEELNNEVLWVRVGGSRGQRHGKRRQPLARARRAGAPLPRARLVPSALRHRSPLRARTAPALALPLPTPLRVRGVRMEEPRLKAERVLWRD